MALGVPVISTDCPSGPREILEGFMPESLVPLDDQEALVKAIKEHLSEKKIIPQEVIERFNPQKIALQYLQM